METRTRISDSEIGQWITGSDSSRYYEIERAICDLTGCEPRRDVDIDYAGDNWAVAVEDEDGNVWVWSHWECDKEWTRSEEPIYYCDIDMGQGGCTWHQAATPEEALEWAMEWARSAKWPDERPYNPYDQYVIVRVWDHKHGECLAEDSFSPWDED